MIKDEPIAAKRVISARLYDDDGNGLDLGFSFSIGDLKIIQPDLSVDDATNLPVAIAGAQVGSFYIQLTAAEIDQVGKLRLQLATTGVAFWEWEEEITDATSGDTATANAVLTTLRGWSHDTGVTFEGLMVRLEAFIANKYTTTGTRSTRHRKFFKRDGETVAFEGDVDNSSASRGQSTTSGSEP